MAVFDRLIAEQRGYLFPWVPVAMAFGIGGYFALAVEPGRGLFLGIAALAGLLLLLAWRGTETWRPVAAALLFAVIGFGLAAGRAHWVAAPVLEFRYYGPIEGRLVEVDRSLSDKLRLTLDQVVLFNTPPHRTPAMVRVSLHGDGLRSAPVPGQRLILTGHLSAPMGPAEPGGFDFRRLAWFERLGAVGYTRSPVLVLDPAPQGGELWVNRQRLRLSKAIQAELPGQRGAFAAAILTGDRSGLERPTIDAMRATNLAHLLAISGLHMGLLTGFVFLVLRHRDSLGKVTFQAKLGSQ
ncbi:MAG: ComEC/Rec2 family competence protein, partial [Mangrovicoccus sp.]